jgi:phenylacetate-CoA ligase
MYEQLFKHLLFPLYEGPLRRRNTHAYLREYERSQWLDRSALERCQLEKLNALLAHCWTNVPFLARHWRGAGLKERPLQAVSELADYPTIDKRLISANFEDMRARQFAGRVLSKTTGGSTGDPLQFEYSEESYARRTAVMWRGYRWAGADLGRRTAYVWGVGAPGPGLRGLKDRCYHAAFNRLFLDSFAMSESNLATYIEALNRFRPRVIVGYVAPLVMLAKWVSEQKVAVHRPQSILSGAEPLTPHDRELIEGAFGAPAYNTYGCREFMLMGSECSARRGLHASADHLVLETVDASGRPLLGESGAVCVTDLHNYAMPFVRYLNGDAAVLGERVCECGRGLPLLESIDGRLLDVIVTPDGRKVPGEFFVYVMLYFPNVLRYQVVQDARDEVEVRVVPRSGELSAAERDGITAKVAEKMGTSARIKIKVLRDIPLTRSGKRRVTVSNIAS